MTVVVALLLVVFVSLLVPFSATGLGTIRHVNRELQQSTTTTTTATITWSERALAFKSYFGEFGISSKFDLETPGTAQNKAVLWLADDDPRQLSVPMSSVGSPEGYRILQRYLLAVSYYQLGGSKWVHRLGFLSGNSTCNWNQQVELTNNNSSSSGSDGSAASSSNHARSNFFERRRRFAGVVCDSNGRVVNLSLSGINARSCIPREMECLTTLTNVDLSGNTNVTCSRLPHALYGKVTTTN